MNACAHVARALRLAPGTAREIGRRVMLGENRAREALTALVLAGCVKRYRIKRIKPLFYALREQ